MQGEGESAESAAVRRSMGHSGMLPGGKQGPWLGSASAAYTQCQRAPPLASPRRPHETWHSCPRPAFHVYSREVRGQQTHDSLLLDVDCMWRLHKVIWEMNLAPPWLTSTSYQVPLEAAVLGGMSLLPRNPGTHSHGPERGSRSLRPELVSGGAPTVEGRPVPST